MPYQFRHYDEYEIEHLNTEALAHLELVDRCLAITDIEPAHLEAMSDDELRYLLGHRVPSKPQRISVPVVPPKPIKPRRTGRRYPAKLWDSQNSVTVHLGVFETEAQRDAAIVDAKTRRALGLPIKG